MKLNDSYLEIMPAKGNKRLEKISKKIDLNEINNSTLFVRNVPPDSSESEIYNIFKECGEIKGIRLPLRQDDPKKKKGLCFIDFADKNSIKKAFELDGYQIRGWHLKVDIDATYDEDTKQKVGIGSKNKPLNDINTTKNPDEVTKPIDSPTDPRLNNNTRLINNNDPYTVQSSKYNHFFQNMNYINYVKASCPYNQNSFNKIPENS